MFHGDMQYLWKAKWSIDYECSASTLCYALTTMYTTIHELLYLCVTTISDARDYYYYLK